VLRVSLSKNQTQALVSLLATIGSHSIDIREGTSPIGIRVTVWNPAYSDPIVYRIDPDGTTRESAL